MIWKNIMWWGLYSFMLLEFAVMIIIVDSMSSGWGVFVSLCLGFVAGMIGREIIKQ